MSSMISMKNLSLKTRLGGDYAAVIAFDRGSNAVVSDARVIQSELSVRLKKGVYVGCLDGCHQDSKW